MIDRVLLSIYAQKHLSGKSLFGQCV